MYFRLIILLVGSFVGSAFATAESAVDFAPVGDESARFQTEVLLTDLDNPTGIVFRPTEAKQGPFELFFAESGAGRVLRVSTAAWEQVDEVIIDFPMSTIGQQSDFRAGPLALGFLTRAKLVVGAKGEQPNADTLAGYVLSTDSLPVSATSHEHVVGPLDDSKALKVDGLSFYNLAWRDRICFITTGGSDSQGWILKAGVQANRLAYLQPFFEVQQQVGAGGPTGVAIIPEPRPPFLVVALMGSRETPQDSRLAYFAPASGKLALNLPTGLHDIVSLAYSATGQLYAADFSWREESSGGVYRLDDARQAGQQTCRAVKVASIEHPFALAFAPDGALYVTSFGEGENMKQGRITKITGEL